MRDYLATNNEMGSPEALLPAQSWWNHLQRMPNDSKYRHSGHPAESPHRKHKLSGSCCLTPSSVIACSAWLRSVTFVIPSTFSLFPFTPVNFVYNWRHCQNNIEANKPRQWPASPAGVHELSKDFVDDRWFTIRRLDLLKEADTPCVNFALDLT